jgi:streptogramin lyase
VRHSRLPSVFLPFALVVLGGTGSPVQAHRGIAEYPIPTVGGDPYDIAVGPDGNMWFTEEQGDKNRTNHTRRGDKGVSDPSRGSPNGHH